MPYKTLVVSPKTELTFTDDEVQQVVNLLGAKMLRTQANIHGLLAALDEQFDILWFATHGDEKGVYLEDGILNTSEITALVRSAGVKLVVLNTCSSKPVAREIYEELGVQLVCTVKKVPDRSAFITATLFARKVASGLSFYESYRAAKPGQNTVYLFLPEKEMEMQQPEKRTSSVDIDLSNLLISVNRLYQMVVTGDREYGTEGLIPAVRRLSAEVEQLVEDVEIMRRNQDFNRKTLYIVVGICSCLLIAVVYLVAQRGV